MEVHHHSHPDTSGHKKKWTHHLWEFIMLFLAVFCGFLAENIREHIVEHTKAKEYAETLILDLQSDIKTVTTFEGNTKKVVSVLDSLSGIIGDNRVKQVKGGNLYYYGRFCNGGLQVLWHNATLEQMKNSGSVRYFRNIGLVNKISEYYAKAKEIDSKYETDLTRIALATDLRNQVFNAHYLEPFTRVYFTINASAESTHLVDSLRTTDMPLQTYEPNLLNQLANICMTRRLNYVITLNDYKAIKKLAEDLMIMLKNEYHLND